MAFTSVLLYRGLFDVTETAGQVSRPDATSTGLAMLFDSINRAVRLEGLVDVASMYLVAAAADTDFDLTAMPVARDLAETVDLTGKKLVAWGFLAATANNAAGLVIKPGAADPYFLFGTTSDRLTLYPGDQTQGAQAAVTTLYKPAVSGTAKKIRVTATVADTLHGLLLFK